MSAIGQNGPATGQIPDILNRLRAALAPWFPDPANAPVLTSVLTAQADAFAFVYQYLQFAARQTRIKTATGGWLDLIAWDFFGANFLRRAGEPDASFQARILKELVRPRQTRAALVQLITDLTGNAPQIQEAWNPQDWGCYGNVPGSGCGYGMAIGYGSLQYPNQVFISTIQTGAGIPNVAGYGAGNGGGYGACGSLSEYADISQTVGAVTPAEVLLRISQTVAAGVTAWVDIVGAFPSLPAYPPPPPNRDWPNPRGAVPAIDLRTWTASPLPNLYGLDVLLYGLGRGPVYDYPNPRGAVPPVDLRTFINRGGQAGLADVLLYGLGRGPVYDWPNPRGVVPAIDLRTFINRGGQAQFAGLDVMLYGAGHAPVYDYPNPRGAVPPVDLKTHVNPGGQARFLGLDAMFGGPGETHPYDWPNPRPAPPGPLDTRTWINTAFALINAPPLRTYDWPHPRGPQAAAVDTRTWINAGGALPNAAMPW